MAILSYNNPEKYTHEILLYKKESVHGKKEE